MKAVRFCQILKFRAKYGFREKNRKEIELSVRKTKNGNSPTKDLELKTPSDLRTNGVGWFRKLSSSDNF